MIYQKQNFLFNDNRTNEIDETYKFPYYEGEVGKSAYQFVVKYVENQVPEFLHLLNQPEKPVDNLTHTMYRNQTFNDVIVAFDGDNDMLRFTFSPVGSYPFPTDMNTTQEYLVQDPETKTYDQGRYLKWTPKNSGVYKTKITINDQDEYRPKTAETVLTITVLNRKPVVDSLSELNPPMYVGETCKWKIHAHDDDGDELDYILVSGHPATMQVDDTGGVQWVPPAKMSDTHHNLTVKVNDDEEDSEEKTFPIYISNRAPVFNNDTLSDSAYTVAHGNHSFKMPIVVEDLDGDDFTVSVSPEDKAKLNTYNLQLIQGPDKRYWVTTQDGKVYYDLDEPTTISFQLLANDSKKDGLAIYDHSLTIYPNYAPDIDVEDVKQGEAGKEDTILFFWNDEEINPVYNEAIILVSDKNGDRITFDKNADLPTYMTIVDNPSITDSYKLTYTSTGQEDEKSANHELILKASDDFGGSTEKKFIIKVVSKYYKNKVVPYEEDQFGREVDGDKVQVFKNEQLLYFKANESKVVLPIEPDNPSLNTPWTRDEYITFTFLTTYGDHVKIKGAENIGTLSGNYIRLAWHITESEGHSNINNFPNSKGTPYFFTGTTWRYIIEYKDEQNIPTDWENVYPLAVGNYVRIKTAGDPSDY